MNRSRAKDSPPCCDARREFLHECDFTHTSRTAPTVPSFREAKSHKRVAGVGCPSRVPPGCDHDELTPFLTAYFDFVRHRGRLTACRQVMLPLLFAGLDVEGPNRVVSDRPRDEGKACRCQDRPSKAGNAIDAKGPAQRLLPHDVAGSKIDRVQVAPGRGIAGNIKEESEFLSKE